MRWTSRPSRGDPRPPAAAVLIAVLAAAWGCSGKDAASVPPPTILVAPADADVFEGQQALFQVQAEATSGITYQWRRDGIAIPGAVDSHYQTPATAASDDGAVYSVVVTNGGASSLESAGAVLTVRPPVDLRFKWVGSPRPLSWSYVTNMLPSGWTTYYDAASTPLRVGVGTCAGLLNCSWWYGVARSIGTTAKLESGPIARLADALSSLPPNTVVTSLDLEADAGAYAMSSTSTTQLGAFTPVVTGSVAVGDLAALASSEGAQGRVLTAVSFSGGLVTYVSQGWTLCGGRRFDAQVVPSTFPTAFADMTTLASQGFVVTAFGAGDEGANGVVIVGTRPEGVATPRTISSGGLRDLAGAGVVAAYDDLTATPLAWVAEQ